jgi:hypothetical protein
VICRTNTKQKPHSLASNLQTFYYVVNRQAPSCNKHPPHHHRQQNHKLDCLFRSPLSAISCLTRYLPPGCGHRDLLPVSKLGAIFYHSLDRILCFRYFRHTVTQRANRRAKQHLAIVSGKHTRQLILTNSNLVSVVTTIDSSG